MYVYVLVIISQNIFKLVLILSDYISELIKIQLF
jgi:hypothetical protein